MHKIAICISFFLMGLTISSQNSFELHIQKPYYEVPGDMVIDNQGCYVIAGNSVDINTNVQSGFLLKVGASGDEIKYSTYVVPDSTCFFEDIVKLDSNYLVFGGVGPISLGLTSILVCSFDFDLNLLWRKSYRVSDIHTISSFDAKIDLDGNIVIIGMAFREIKYSNADPFEFKCNIQGDSILLVVEPLDGNQLVFDFLINPDSSGYISFGSGTYPQYPPIDANGAFYNHSFIRGQVKEVPNGLYWSHTVKWINDTVFFISGNKRIYNPTTINGIGLMSLDTAFSMVDEVHFGHFPDTASYPGWERSFDYLDINNIFFTGTKNWDAVFQSMPSWIILMKFDSTLNILCERYYGGDVMYSSNLISATEDGGCIIAGTRYDYNNQDYNYDLYLIKTDENGLVTTIDEEREINEVNVLVSPNPGANYLKVRVAAHYKKSNFELYDISGKVVLSKQIYGKWGEINTSHLPSGTYIYRIYNEEGLFESGKWLKN